MSEKVTSPSWRRNLIAIGFAELMAIVGFAAANPLLPLYVQELGVQGEQEIRIWAGIVLAAHPVTMSIFGPIWGMLGDRYGRKVMVQRAMFSGAVLVGLTGLAQSVHQLMLLRVMQGALTGTVTAATALVATSVPRKRIGYALGLLQVGIYAGASIGPMLGGVLSDNVGYQPTFWIMGGLLFLAALGVLLFVEEEFEPTASPGDGQTAEDADEARLPLWGRLAPILGSSALLGVLGVRLLTRLGANLLRPVLPLFVQEIVPVGGRVASITGLISGVGAGAGAVGALGLGRLGDRTGYRKILIACALVSALCYAPQCLVGNPLWLLPLQAGTGLAMGGVLAAASASLAKLAPEGQQGFIYGLEASAVSVSSAVGSIGSSALMAWLGLRPPFLVAAGLFVLAGIVAAWLLPRRSS